MSYVGNNPNKMTVPVAGMVKSDGNVLQAAVAGTDYPSVAAVTTAQATADSAQALANTSATTLAQCYLTTSGANLVLQPVNGNKLSINGTPQTVPSAGVTLAPSAGADALFYIYAYMNAGVMTLEASTTVPVQDTTTGMMVKTGDASRLLVGYAYRKGNAWVDTEIARLVASHFNRRQRTIERILSGNQGTTSTTLTQFAGQMQVEVLTPPLTPDRLFVEVAFQHSAAGGKCTTAVFFNGAQASQFRYHNTLTAGDPDIISFSQRLGVSASPAYTMFQVYGATNTGTLTWLGTAGQACTIQGAITS